VLNPLVISTAAWADADILGQGMLSCPPVLFDTETPFNEFANNGCLAQREVVKAKRRFSRTNHGIFLALGYIGDGESAIKVTLTHRSRLDLPAVD